MAEQKPHTLVVDNDSFFADVREELAGGALVTIPVKGMSMLPFIIQGRDQVVLEPLGDRPIAKDDIVLFTYHDRYVLHRVLSVDGDRLIIRGDGVPKNCERVTTEYVHAHVAKILRRGVEEIDPYSPSMLAKVHTWQGMHPFIRRCILAVLRRTIWRKYYKDSNRPLLRKRK